MGGHEAGLAVGTGVLDCIPGFLKWFGSTLSQIVRQMSLAVSFALLWIPNPPIPWGSEKAHVQV